jgi:predicted Zn-dependent protease
MPFATRLLEALAAALLVTGANADRADPNQTLSYEPHALGWSAAELAHATAAPGEQLLARAEAQGLRACSRHCVRLQAVFQRLLPLALRQSEHARQAAWRLETLGLPEVEAQAQPDGLLLVSEVFIEQRGLSDAELAFVLAHEMAHVILEHERQALSYARLLLPRQVARSVRDMYVEIDHNFALLKAMEPVLQQGELEADELGLLLAAAAGYAPLAQLRFLEREAQLPAPPRGLVRSHPGAAERLAALRERLPLAQRLHEQASSEP